MKRPLSTALPANPAPLKKHNRIFKVIGQSLPRRDLHQGFWAEELVNDVRLRHAARAHDPPMVAGAVPVKVDEMLDQDIPGTQVV